MTPTHSYLQSFAQPRADSSSNSTSLPASHSASSQLTGKGKSQLPKPAKDKQANERKLSNQCPSSPDKLRGSRLQALRHVPPKNEKETLSISTLGIHIETRTRFNDPLSRDLEPQPQVYNHQKCQIPTQARVLYTHVSDPIKA